MPPSRQAQYAMTATDPEAFIYTYIQTHETRTKVIYKKKALTEHSRLEHSSLQPYPGVLGEGFLEGPPWVPVLGDVLA